MDEKKKVPGRPFKVGNPGGPGRKPTPKDLKGVKKMSRYEFELRLAKYASCTLAELKKHRRHPDTPALDLMLLSVMIKGIGQGDHQRWNALVDRMFGKVKDKVDLSSSDGSMSGGGTVNVYIPDNGRDKDDG